MLSTHKPRPVISLKHNDVMLCSLPFAALHSCCSPGERGRGMQPASQHDRADTHQPAPKCCVLCHAHSTRRSQSGSLLSRESTLTMAEGHLCAPTGSEEPARQFTSGCHQGPPLRTALCPTGFSGSARKTKATWECCSSLMPIHRRENPETTRFIGSCHALCVYHPSMVLVTWNALKNPSGCQLLPLPPKWLLTDLSQPEL